MLRVCLTLLIAAFGVPNLYAQNAYEFRDSGGSIIGAVDQNGNTNMDGEVGVMLSSDTVNAESINSLTYVVTTSTGVTVKAEPVFIICGMTLSNAGGATKTYTYSISVDGSIVSVEKSRTVANGGEGDVNVFTVYTPTAGHRHFECRVKTDSTGGTQQALTSATAIVQP